MKTLKQICAKINSKHADMIYVAKQYTKADLIKDLLKLDK